MQNISHDHWGGDVMHVLWKSENNLRSGGAPASYLIPHMDAYGGFHKWGYPQIIHFDGFFYYKSSILAYPRFMVFLSTRNFERVDFVATSWASLHPAAGRDAPSCGRKYRSSTPGWDEEVLPGTEKNQLLMFGALFESVRTFDFWSLARRLDVVVDRIEPLQIWSSFVTRWPCKRQLRTLMRIFSEDQELCRKPRQQQHHSTLAHHT